VATVQFHFLEQGGVALTNVRFEADSVAKLRKCRATNFPLKDEISGKQRPISLQARHRSRL
jgi:hypothetical protein